MKNKLFTLGFIVFGSCSFCTNSWAKWWADNGDVKSHKESRTLGAIGSDSIVEQVLQIQGVSQASKVRIKGSKYLLMVNHKGKRMAIEMDSYRGTIKRLDINWQDFQGKFDKLPLLGVSQRIRIPSKSGKNFDLPNNRK